MTMNTKKPKTMIDITLEKGESEVRYIIEKGEFAYEVLGSTVQYRLVHYGTSYQHVGGRKIVAGIFGIQLALKPMAGYKITASTSLDKSVSK